MGFLPGRLRLMIPPFNHASGAGSRGVNYAPERGLFLVLKRGGRTSLKSGCQSGAKRVMIKLLMSIPKRASEALRSSRGRSK